MPQLDAFSFSNQFISFAIGFILIYYINLVFILPWYVWLEEWRFQILNMEFFELLWDHNWHILLPIDIIFYIDMAKINLEHMFYWGIKFLLWERFLVKSRFFVPEFNRFKVQGRRSWKRWSERGYVIRWADYYSQEMVTAFDPNYDYFEEDEIASQFGDFSLEKYLNLSFTIDNTAKFFQWILLLSLTTVIFLTGSLSFSPEKLMFIYFLFLILFISILIGSEINFFFYEDTFSYWEDFWNIEGWLLESISFLEVVYDLTIKQFIKMTINCLTSQFSSFVFFGFLNSSVSE